MKRRAAAISIMVFALLLIAPEAQGQVLPKISVGVDRASQPSDVAVTLEIILLLTILSVAPAIFIMVTSFTRVVVVFSFLRHALGTQQAPPAQVMVGLAVFITIFVMAPVWNDVNVNALQPYLDNKISQKEAIDNTLRPVREFMLKQTREKDLALFVNMAGLEKPENENDIPTHVLIPAFIINELRIAFQVGFLLYIPFLMLDLIIASVLMSMGMMMLPPVMISLPFKLLLFVLVDGWHLIVESIILGFN